MVNHRTRLTSILSAMLALTLVAVAAPAASAAQGPIGVWRLKGNFKNSKGAPPKIVRLGATAFETLKVRGVTTKVLAFDEGEGLQIRKIPKSARRSFTIDLLFEFDALFGYRRIIAFGPNNIDAGLYFNKGHISLYPKKESATPVVAANKWVRVRVTRSAKTGLMKVFINGTLRLKFKDKNGKYKLKKGKLTLFQDDPGTEEHPSGTASAIRFWNRVVTP